MKNFRSPKAMLEWQYRSMLEELTELQRHASDPTCPCVLSDSGEFCLPKHALGLRTLAAETAAMDDTHLEMLDKLAEEALEQHDALKDRITCGKAHKDEKDTVEWARQWRKRLESIYYYATCPMKRPHKVPIHVKDPGTEQVVVTYLHNGDIQHTATVSNGGQHSAPLPVDRILSDAHKHHANGIVLAHNHPSGNLNVSEDDVDSTKILCQRAAEKGVKCLDHLIVGNGVSSFSQKHIKLSEPTGDVRVTGCRSKRTCTMNHYARDAFRESVVSPEEKPATIAAIEKELNLGRGRKHGTPETFALGARSLSRYELRYRLVEAHDLQVSHDPMTFTPNPAYPQELQPRDRTRAADQAQVIVMAAKLDPDALLTEFHSIDRGAPIVGPDMFVESGNGRVMSILRAIQENPEQYDKYRDALKIAAPEYGIPVSQLAKFQYPVLVRERLTQVDRATFGKEANLSTSLGSSPIETARADAGLLRVQDIFNLEVGENQGIDDALRASVNQGFVKAFLAQLELNQRAGIVDSEGKLNQEGVRRLKMAMFVRAFPGDIGLRLAEKFFESTEDTVKNVLNGILKALGKLAQSEALVANGQRSSDLSIADDLTRAVNIYARIKATPDYTVAKYLAQLQLQTRELTTFQERLLTELDKRARSGKAIGEMLNAYAQAVLDSSPPSQGGLLDLPPLTKEDLWNTATRRSETVAVSDFNLFDPLGAYVDLCNLSAQDQGGIWNYRPLREFIMWASAYGEVQICNAGFVPGSIQLTFKGVNSLPIEKRAEFSQRASKVPLLKEIATFGSADRIFTILLPRMEATPSELLGGQQFIESRAVHGEMGKQTALFDSGGDIDDADLFQSAEQEV